MELESKGFNRKILSNTKSKLWVKKEAIEALIEKLYANGGVSDKDGFLKDVMAREAIGATNVGMKLAIPHGKSDFVTKPCFAAATVKTSIKDWEKLDESEDDAELIFLIAAPNSKSGNAHLEILTKLTTKLSDEELVDKLINAKSENEFLNLLSEEKAKVEDNFDSDKPVLGITACPAGIARAYMAAEAMEKAGRKLGVKVRTEKQGANGIEGRFTNQEINSADAVIYAAEVAIKEKERFKGIPSIEVPVAEPIKNGEGLIKRVLEVAKNGRNTHVDGFEDTERKLSFREESKRAILTGVSHIVRWWNNTD